MIFSTPGAVDKILSCRKTQTRRPASGPCKYRVGQDYSVQPGRGKREVARIFVFAIRRERLCDISSRDVFREGLDSADDFWDRWSDMYAPFSRDDEVDVIDFKLVARVPS